MKLTKGKFTMVERDSHGLPSRNETVNGWWFHCRLSSHVFVKVIVHRYQQQWRVSDLKTGAAFIFRQDTRREAVDAAKARLARISFDRWTETQAEVIRQINEGTEQ